MVNVYIDSVGAVRSSASGRLIAPAGTTSAACRMQARLWAAAASALDVSTAASPGRGEGMAAVVTPISAAPNFQPHPVAVIDVRQIHDETERALAALTAPREDAR